MADKKKSDEQNGNDEPLLKEKSYEKIIERLRAEQQHIQEELDRDYREARRYVRAHPEEGVLIGFLGGIAVGLLLGKLSK